MDLNIGGKMFVLLFIFMFGLLILLYWYLVRPWQKLAETVEVQPWEYSEYVPYY